LVIGLIVAPVWLACTAQHLAETPLPESDAAVHAVHEQRLADTMRRLEALRMERLPTELDVDLAERREARGFAQAAREMGDSAAWIPLATPATLSPDEQAEFREIAKTLQDQAHRMAEDAPDLSTERRGARLSEIEATCVRCHSRFRIPGVASEPR
jgi:hypothetical protein